MIAKDLLSVAELIHKAILRETTNVEEAYLVLTIVNALLSNDQRQMK